MGQFGPIDIYLFDQLLRGRIAPGMRVLDAGCGGGRNLVYLLREGFDVWGTDGDAAAVASVRDLAARLAPSLPPDRFRVEPVEAAVVRRSIDGRGHQQCRAPLRPRPRALRRDGRRQMWRVLAPGGVFFCRLASSIGMEDRMRPIGDGRFHLPDGSVRYLVDEARLMALTAALGGVLLDPLKTTIVQDQRCMTTWVLRRPAASG